MIARLRTLRIAQEKAERLEAHLSTVRGDLWAARNAQVAAEAQVESLKQTLSYEQRRYDDLLKVTMDLRREGFNPTPAPVQPERMEDAVNPAIRSAVRDLADEGSSLYYTLIHEAEALLAANTPLEDVLKSIRTGSSYNPLHA